MEWVSVLGEVVWVEVRLLLIENRRVIGEPFDESSCCVLLWIYELDRNVVYVEYVGMYFKWNQLRMIFPNIYCENDSLKWEKKLIPKQT